MTDVSIILDGFRMGFYVFVAAKLLTWGWLRIKSLFS